MRLSVFLLAMLSTPAYATTVEPVPEMNVGAGVAAIALLVGVAAIIREKTKRK